MKLTVLFFAAALLQEPSPTARVMLVAPDAEERLSREDYDMNNEALEAVVVFVDAFNRCDGELFAGLLYADFAGRFFFSDTLLYGDALLDVFDEMCAQDERPSIELQIESLDALPNAVVLNVVGTMAYLDIQYELHGMFYMIQNPVVREDHDYYLRRALLSAVSIDPDDGDQ